MPEKKIESAIELYDYVTHAVAAEYEKLLDFSKEFHDIYLNEKRKLPYHINVIDELHINENGHSRILLKLLQFVNERGEWEILQSLVNYIKSRSKSREFDRVIIIKPEITQEKARIDLWVRDKRGNYAIIFENKIYNADDQEAQLSRYIDKTKECPFDLNNIFVVYLSQTGSEPDSQSWGDYQQIFMDRYINLSFRDDILPWLKTNVLPNIKYKDNYLINAIQQYIDYLEGLFDLRTIQNNMNMSIKNIIEEKLKLNECKNDKERYSIVVENKKNIDELSGKLWEIQEGLRKKIMNKTIDDIAMKNPDIKKNENEGWPFVTTFFGGEEIKVSFLRWSNRFCCQVEYTSGKELSDENEIVRRISELLNKKNQNQRWGEYGDNLFELCNAFEKVIEKLTK